MQVRETPKFWAFRGKFQTPEWGFGLATAYVRKEHWTAKCRVYGWGENAKPTDKVVGKYVGQCALHEVLFDRGLVSRMVWS